MVVGLFWGMYTGHYETSLSISIFFELFWLDLIPVGTFIPPHLTAATFAALSLTTYFGFESPSKITAILFASMPLAWLGTKMEDWIRSREQGSYNKLLNWARNPQNPHLPGTLIIRSLAMNLAFAWATFLVSILALRQGLELLFSFYPGLFSSLAIQWPHLWVAATLGGLMALRIKRAYAILGVGMILFLLFTVLGCF